jgi:hypothetical protein
MIEFELGWRAGIGHSKHCLTCAALWARLSEPGADRPGILGGAEDHLVEAHKLSQRREADTAAAANAWARDAERYAAQGRVA